MIHFNVGQYRIDYEPNEMIGDHPLDIFFDFKTDTPFIYKENFLTSDEIKLVYQESLMNFSKKTYAQVHDYSNNIVGYKVDTSGRYTHVIPCSKVVYDLLEKKLKDSIYDELKNHYVINGNFKRSEGWQVLGYGKDFFFRRHADNCSARGDGQVWTCNVPNRKFTILLYLNDQDQNNPSAGSYAGGNLNLNKVYHSSNDKNCVSFAPKAGTLIAMPSNFFFSHEVEIVTKGYRFACVTWVDVEKL